MTAATSCSDQLWMNCLQSRVSGNFLRPWGLGRVTRNPVFKVLRRDGAEFRSYNLARSHARTESETLFWLEHLHLRIQENE